MTCPLCGADAEYVRESNGWFYCENCEDKFQANQAEPPLGHIRITNAPESYDGFGTRTLEILPFRDKRDFRPFRKISIPEAAKVNDWQEMRYASGLYGCFPLELWEDLRDRIAVPAPTPADPFHVKDGFGPDAPTVCGQPGRSLQFRQIQEIDRPAMCPACRDAFDGAQP